MATTLTSSIVDIDIALLKHQLEALGDIHVVSITPPSGVILTTVVLTKGDKISNLSPGQEVSAQNVIDTHVDSFDESVQEVSQTKATIGTEEPGEIDFVNDGLAWRIGPDKNFIPGASGRKIGAPGNPVSTLYVNTIVGAVVTGSSSSVFNEVPSGLMNGSNTVFLTSVDFIPNTTRVFYNGSRQTLGALKAYQETGTNEITLNFAPESGEDLIVDYDPA